MKKLLILFPFILLISCSVQKRKYQSGYYVDWHNKSSHKEKPQTLAKKNEVKSTPTATPQETPHNTSENKQIVASADAKTTILEFKKTVHFFPPGDTCDVLVFKDGSEIKGKVKEIGLNEIKYKRCDSPDGPTYISRKSELFMIKYANGTREVIKSEPSQAPITSAPVNPYRPNKFRKENHPLAIAALILGILSIILAYATLIFISASAGFGVSIFILPAVAGLAAILAGKTALNRIKEQPDLYKGKGMAIPGFIMGIVILSIFLLVFFVAAVLGLGI